MDQLRIKAAGCIDATTAHIPCYVQQRCELILVKSMGRLEVGYHYWASDTEPESLQRDTNFVCMDARNSFIRMVLFFSYGLHRLRQCSSIHCAIRCSLFFLRH